MHSETHDEEIADSGSAQSKRAKQSKDSSIVELLVVLVIIGALAAITVPAYNHYISTAQITLAHGTLDTIRKTLDNYHVANQRYPTDIDFSSGLDDQRHAVLGNLLLEQIESDFSSITSYTYNATSDSYLLTVRATNSARTEMTLSSVEGISR